jgi:hypothetical protein
LRATASEEKLDQEAEKIKEGEMQFSYFRMKKKQKKALQNRLLQRHNEDSKTISK